MSKGKFASLIMLVAFSAGIASSSAVSAQGNESLASVTDVNGIRTHDDSVSVVSKVSSEPAIADDETKIDTEVTTDKEVQTVSSENKTNLPENSDKDNKNKDYVFFDKTKKAKRIKKKKTKVAKISAMTAGGAIAIGSAAFGISKLAKPFGKNDKKDDPSKATTPKPDNPNNPSKATTPKPDNPNDPSKDTTSKSDNPNDPSKATTPKPDNPNNPSKAIIPKPDNPNNPSKATTSKSDNPNNPSKATTPKPDIPNDPSKGTTSKSDNPNDPSKDPTPEPDIPSDPKKEEKEEKNISFATWYKNNLGASITLTILSVYLIQFLVRMIIFEVKQQKELKKSTFSNSGIYFIFGEYEDQNIKPFFGLWKGFTNNARFSKDGSISSTTVKYAGTERVAMNALAAATFAKYDWQVI